MKRQSVWLAAGLLLFAVLACNLGKNKNNSNNSNSNSTSNKNSNSPVINRPANAEVYVDSLNMAKDDDGKAGDATTTFAPSDSKIHCVINLNKAKGGTKIKTVWIAANVEGTKNQELKTLDYTTNSFEKRITGYLTWKGDWPKGQYRLEVYINGALDKTIDYTIE
jgi:hypothetical protein